MTTMEPSPQCQQIDYDAVSKRLDDMTMATTAHLIVVLFSMAMIGLCLLDLPILLRALFGLVGCVGCTFGIVSMRRINKEEDVIRGKLREAYHPGCDNRLVDLMQRVEE
jgi:hypothetical protein